MVDAAKCWSRAQNASAADFEALFSRIDEVGRTVLQIAVERKDVNAVRLILEKDPAYKPGGEMKRNGLMRLICKAIDDECSDDIIQALSQTYRDGIIDHDPNDVLALIHAIQDLDKAVPRAAENRKVVAHVVDTRKAAADNRKEMVQSVLKYCPNKYKDKILQQKDKNGDTPLHLLISHGCFIPALIKHKGLDTMARNKRDFTPRDMLYVEDATVVDQVPKEPHLHFSLIDEN
ncbi:hypothetical protein ACET3Z_005310 [Daucus carota]